MIKKLSLSLALLILVAVIVRVGNVSAQTAGNNLNLTISPSLLDLTTTPGGKLQERIRVRNNSTSPLNLSVQVSKLTVGDDGQPTPAQPSDTDSFLSWLKFDNQKFTAQPNEWTDVNFTITTPPDSAYGYYYLLRISPDLSAASTTNSATVQGELAVPILLTVQKDGAIAQAKLLDFKTDNFISQYLPVNFSVKMANSGNIHIRPKGNIFISGQGVKQLGTIDVNFEEGTIIPGATRTFQASWDDGFLVRQPVMENGTAKIENGKPVTKLAVNWDKLTHFRIGPYTANLVMVFDDGKRDVVLEKAVTFWVIPYKIIAGIIVTVVILFFVIRWLLKRYVRSQISKNKIS